VVIARSGRPVAKLVPIEAPPPKRQSGTWRGCLRVAEDFDDELWILRIGHRRDVYETIESRQPPDGLSVSEADPQK
jgi:antitoxin (DNA-binding transcriptional repressor) of toxin-antitoxin stability system